MVKKLFLDKRAQMKIQQMAFMIIAVFFFFILVGLFFLNWQFKDIHKDFEELQKREAISSIEVISNMPEFNCESRRELCLDVDKLRVMSSKNYDLDFGVSSIKVYKVYPAFSAVKECPGVDCNYYEVLDLNSSKEYSGYVSLCQKNSEGGYVYEDCDIGKLVVGVAGGENE